MPAPGPGGCWIDDFDGNKLSSKWIATRYSNGGQNDGVWTRDIKNSKIRWVGSSGGTESAYWGEWLSLPVNAPMDITVEASMRQKLNGATYGRFNLSLNGTPFSVDPRYGATFGPFGSADNFKAARIAAGATPFPGFPGKTYQRVGNSDYTSLVRIVRKNGYVFIYMDELYIGQAAYNNTITSVDIGAIWYMGQTATEKWVEYIKIWPREVVL